MWVQEAREKHQLRASNYLQASLAQEVAKKPIVGD